MVSTVDIWFHHFYLVVLQGDMIGFAKAFPVSAREGVAKFWITLYVCKIIYIGQEEKGGTVAILRKLCGIHF